MKEELKTRLEAELGIKPEAIKYNAEGGFYIATIEHPRHYTRLGIQFDDEDISIGFTSGWHTHPDLYGANTEEEKIEKTVQLVLEIITDKVSIAFSNKYGEWLTDDIERELKYEEEDERITIGYWSTVELPWSK
jgi:hypothetical protein